MATIDIGQVQPKSIAVGMAQAFYQWFATFLFLVGDPAGTFMMRAFFADSVKNWRPKEELCS